MLDGGSGESGGNGDGAPYAYTVTRHSKVSDDLDTDFDALANGYRRYLLYHLFEMDGEVTDLDDATDAVCAYEAAGTERKDEPARESVRIALHHTHLPRLSDAGIIDYDPRQGTIRFTGHPPLEEFAEHARHRELE